MGKLRLVRVAFVVLITSNAGCGGKSGTSTLSCTPSCPPGTTCTAGGCTASGEPPDFAASGQPDGGDRCGGGCPRATPKCNADGRCVACLADGDCPPGSVCRAAGAVTLCVPGCSDDARCEGLGGPATLCCGGACTDTATDPANCGACDNACSAVHAAASCVDGACHVGSCSAAWADCNADPGDGCETNLHADANNCGTCGTRCSLPNAFAACSGGSCYPAGCAFGWDDCDAVADNGCEVKVLSDARNCGGCGIACTSPPHARSGCINASCQLTSCDQGFADCDRNPQNGCEVAVGTDVKNCGACGSACGQGLVCRNGGCTCPQCNFPNAKSTCVNNQCVIDACLPDWGDCNKDPKDGCETDVTSDPVNCGACGNGCQMNAPFCYQSMCSLFSLFPNPSYDANLVFNDGLGGTTMAITWDGASYWSVSGGGPGGDRLARYDGNGQLAQKYQPGIDFRSVFTLKGKNMPVYARGFGSNQVQVMNNPGVFGASLTLMGGNLDAQSQVVFDDTGAELIAFNAGTVTRWNAGNGQLIGTVALQGFGNMNAENAYPQNRGIAKAHGYYLTYMSGALSAWNAMGGREKTTVLKNAGTSFDSYFGFSYANGMVLIVDQAGGSWRGYSVGL